MKKIFVAILASFILMGCGQADIPADAVYTFNGETMTADAYYEKLMDFYGFGFIYQLMENMVVAQQPLTEDELAAAKAQYDQIVADYADEENQAYVAGILQGEGYSGWDDLLLYIENNIRKQNVIGAYIDENFTDMSLLEETNPRLVKHVLVLFDDSGSFTTATQLMIEEVDGLLAGSDPLALEETMAELIEGEHVIFEDLGYVDVNTQFETPFLEAALALEKGVLSGWVETTYGFHRIVVYGDTLEDFKGTAGFRNAVLTLDPSFENRAMWALISDNVDLEEDFAALVKAHLEIED